MPKLYTIILLLVATKFAMAAPKITQLESVDFSMGTIDVMAVEEFEKLPKIYAFNGDKKILETTFSEPTLDEFAAVIDFLRFKTYKFKFSKSPVIVAVRVTPTGTDTTYQLKMISEHHHRLIEITPSEIGISSQDAIHIGHLGKKLGYGIITAHFRWDAAHYAPHKFEITIYKYNSKKGIFAINSKFISKSKHTSGCQAISSLHMPCQNIINRIINKNERGNLGAEEEYLK